MKRRPKRKPRARKAVARKGGGLTVTAHSVEKLQRELETRMNDRPPRWNADPDDVQRSVARVVLSLVEFIRKLLERQAIRRLEESSLSPTEVERIGLALMNLEKTIHTMARRFKLRPDELNLDLGPLGRLH